MLLDDLWLVLVAAILADAAIGDPNVLYRRVPHPVVLIGQLINFCESQLRRTVEAGRLVTLIAGGLTVIVTVSIAVCIAVALEHAIVQITAHSSAVVGLAIAAAAGSTLLAGRGLHDHVHRVALALDLGINQARARVSEIVGRDPESLDEAGIARAAIESAAENFVDGFVAPAFWFAVLGLPGIAAYKAINTLDSMIGHRNPRYEYFGKCAAHLDDLATLIPARMGGLCLALAASLVTGASIGKSLSVMGNSAHLHRSPNAGWSEAAMAGALGFALAGPRMYGGERVQDAWMGHGRTNLGAREVHRALQLYRRAWLLAAIVCSLIAVLVHGG